jgi:hypothetical protein
MIARGERQTRVLPANEFHRARISMRTLSIQSKYDNAVSRVTVQLANRNALSYRPIQVLERDRDIASRTI